jgi:SM-20-related protein
MTPASSPLDRIAPHVVRDDFLPADTLRSLIAWTLAREADFVSTLVGGPHGRVDTAIRASRCLPAKTFEPQRALFLDHIAPLVADLCPALGLQHFTVGKIQLGLVCHNDGDYYRRHSDTAVTATRQSATRMISAVFYFHPEPKGFSGGELRLHPFSARAETGAFADLVPAQNRLVAFPSWAPHEVMPVSCPSGAFAASRFSVNCWIHRALPDGDQ